MLVQIYEIQDPDEAREISGLGVDHVGVLVGDGEFPREIPIAEARSILSTIPRRSKKVVLSLSSERDAVEEIARELQPDILHLGCLLDDRTCDDIRYFKQKFPGLLIMRSIPVINEESIEQAKQISVTADFLLLDSYKRDDQQIGATGEVHDWNLSRKIVESVGVPVILAGGLGPENVADAIRKVRPAGVDSKTRTDREGTHRKDLEKVRRFVTAARMTPD